MAEYKTLLYLSLISALTNFYQFYVQNEQIKEDVLNKVVSKSINIM